MARKAAAGKVPAKKRVPRPRKAAASPAVALRPLHDEAALADAFALLLDADREFVARLAAEAGPPPLRHRPPGLAGLAWIVVSQQVSTASAKAIYGRLATRLPDMGCDALLACTDDELRACGLSAPKLRTLRAIAQAVHEGALDFALLERMSADEAHAALTAIKGIGPWTADIFLLFCLGHPDAFPAGDLALQEAARMALRLRSRPDAKKLAAIAERWRPVRGVAARLLWAWYGVAKKTGG